VPDDSLGSFDYLLHHAANDKIHFLGGPSESVGCVMFPSLNRFPVIPWTVARWRWRAGGSGLLYRGEFVELRAEVGLDQGAALLRKGSGVEEIMTRHNFEEWEVIALIR